MTDAQAVVVRDPEFAVRVAAKRPEADGVTSIELVAREGGVLPRWEPGAHVDVVISDVAERQYSLSGDPQDRSRYRLGVLRDENGRGSSRYIHDVLAIGDEIHLRGPRNHFELRPSPNYLFIAGGIGITPILPMLRTAEAAGAGWRMAYGGRRRASMGFLDELSRYGGKVSIAPQDETGLLDLNGILGEPSDDTLVYCCGPEPLLTAVETHCVSWPAGTLRVERFAARPLNDAPPAAAFEVVLAQSGRTVPVPAECSILQALRAEGLALASSCEEGTCGTCETAVLEGKVDHRDSLLDTEERGANDCMMICVSRSLTPRLVLDL